MAIRFGHLLSKLDKITSSKDSSVEEMQEQIRDLSHAITEVMRFLDKGLLSRLQKEQDEQHRNRS